MRLRHCAACGRRDQLQRHHLVHRAKGGSDDESNLVTLCYDCHLAAHGKRRRRAVVVPRPPAALLVRVVRVLLVLALTIAIGWYLEILVYIAIGFGVALLWELSKRYPWFGWLLFILVGGLIILMCGGSRGRRRRW